MSSDILKSLIARALGPRAAQRVRRFYLVRQVMYERYAREPNLLILKSLIRSGDCVADVGANVGVYTMEFSRLVGTHGTVCSFEPIKQNYDILENLISAAPLPNVRPFRVAFGSQSAKRDMVIPNLGGFNGYYRAHLTDGEEAGQREEVNVITLDELWKSHPMKQIDFIKCDAEGAELEILRGGLDFIRSEHPGWLMEVSSDNSAEVFRLMHDEGFRAFVCAGRLIPTDFYRANEFTDYFFFHPQSKFWSRLAPLMLAGGS